MKDIALITTYFRPEFLSLCLEYLSKAEGARDNKEYWIFNDFRFEDEHRHSNDLRWTKEVLEKSPLPYRFIQREPHNYAGNSYNTLEAYKEAYATDARFVYLIEDDVLVTPDYFLWHEAIQEKESDALCSVGYRCIRNSAARKDISDAGSYFTSKKDYASVGVCWRREHLKEIVDHATPEYYANMGGYLDSRFPQDIFSGWFHEQDGLVMRVMHEQNAFVAWSFVPRCFHMGGYGYHRFGKRPDGQLQNKIDTLRGWIYDGAKLKEMFPDFNDMEPYDDRLNKPFTELVKMEHFE